MIFCLQPLLTLEDNEDKAMLSVGSLVHSYCTSVGDCEQDTVVKKIVATMESKIVRGCKVNKNDVKSVSRYKYPRICALSPGFHGKHYQFGARSIFFLPLHIHMQYTENLGRCKLNFFN